MKKNKRTPIGEKQIVIALVSMLLLTLVSVGTTLAYMKLSTKGVTNTFIAASENTPSIMETFTENAPKKENVRVKVGNPGYAVYVRAQVVINWTDKSGNVLAVTPPAAGTDYDITYTTGSDTSKWFYCESDGFYYYKEPISTGETQNLIDTCTVKKEAPVAGYTLQVDIIAQTIQAVGTTSSGSTEFPAVTEAWGVNVDPITKYISKQ